MKKLQFPLPNLAIQDEIVNYISKINTKIRVICQRVEDLQQLAKREFEEDVFDE